MRRAALTLIGLIVLLTVCPVFAQEDPYLIVPGSRIGHITLGSSLADATKVLGAGHRLSSRQGQTMLCWCNGVQNPGRFHVLDGGLIALLDDSQTVVSLTAHYNGAFRTVDGLHTSTILRGSTLPEGSTDADVFKVFGAPDKVTMPNGSTEWLYRHKGIGFTFEHEKNVVGLVVYGITVFRPA